MKERNALSTWAGFGLGRVSFLHSSWYGTVVWICAGNSVDNVRDVFITDEQCSHSIKAVTALLLTPPHQRGGTRSWEEAQPGQVMPLTKGIFQPIPHHSQYIHLREGGRDGCSSNSICLPKPPMLHVMGTLGAA